MDGFKENRNQLLHMYESAQAVGAKEQKDAAMGTMNLFGDMEDLLISFLYPMWRIYRKTIS